MDLPHRDATQARIAFLEARHIMMLGLLQAQEEQIARQQRVIGWKCAWMMWWDLLWSSPWNALFVCFGMAIGAALILIVTSFLFFGLVGNVLQASSRVQSYSDAGVDRIYDLYGVPSPRQTTCLVYPPVY